MKINLIENNLIEAQEILKEFSLNINNIKAIERAGKLLVNAVKKGNKIISCGNGGSMCDAMHFAEELSGRFREDRQALPAIAISDPSHLTCVGNDYGFEKVFSRYVEALGKKNDILLVFSTSGNSQNIINAIHVAHSKGMKVIALTGKTGGKIAKLCDIEIRAPKSKYADRAQEIHIIVVHSLIQYIEENI